MRSSTKKSTEPNILLQLLGVRRTPWMKCAMMSSVAGDFWIKNDQHTSELRHAGPTWTKFSRIYRPVITIGAASARLSIYSVHVRTRKSAGESILI